MTFSERGGRLVDGVSRSLGAPVATVGNCIRKVVSKMTSAPRGVSECVEAVCGGTGRVGLLVGRLALCSGVSAGQVPCGFAAVSTGKCFTSYTRSLDMRLRSGKTRFACEGFVRRSDGIVMSPRRLQEIVGGVMSGSVGCASGPGIGVAVSMGSIKSFVRMRLKSGKGNVTTGSLPGVFSHFCQASTSEGSSGKKDNVNLSVIGGVIRRRKKGV